MKQSKIFILILVIAAIAASPWVYKSLWQDMFKASEQTFAETQVKEKDKIDKIDQSGAGKEKVDLSEVNEEKADTEEKEEKFPSAKNDTIEEYFKKCLFIGDSRTMGLWEYSDVKNATVFADTGMSTFKILSQSVNVEGYGKITLEELLKEKEYPYIYIMLGINELGYDHTRALTEYEKLLNTVQTLQPNAVIYLEANLHMSKSKSDGDDIYNNANIDAFNQSAAQLADNKKVFYLDVNPVFDDNNHALAEEYTTDGAHILGKEYQTWGKWLYDNRK